MKYPVYPQYKDSGVAWLGEVPSDWEIKGLRYVCRLAYGDPLAAENREDGEIAVYGSNGQVGSHIVSNTKAPVIVVGRKGSFGKINYSDQPVFAIDTTYYIDSSCTSNSLNWLKYALLVLRLDENSKDSAVPGLAREDAYSSKLPVPSNLEQTSIADFLDRETGRIDTLVAKKRKLVELLKEKRSALISRTVTRGLPADAAREFGLEAHSNFKPVAIECLTEIPETWTEKKLKHLGYITPGFAFNSADFESSGIRVLKISNVQTGKLDWTDDSYIPKELYEKHKFFAVKDGDVVFALTRPIISTGLKAAVARVGEEKILLNQRNARFRPYKGFNYGFLYYTLFSDYFIAEFEMCIDATGQQPNISTIDIANIEIVTPPNSEQTAIATYLDRETTKIDRLVEKVETAINRLQEYRSALITAAVTGKIDVREYV
jgi:type I restriction enzyme S subunit